jgi:hypothetical protein
VRTITVIEKNDIRLAGARLHGHLAGTFEELLLGVPSPMLLKVHEAVLLTPTSRQFAPHCRQIRRSMLGDSTRDPADAGISSRTPYFRVLRTAGRQQGVRPRPDPTDQRPVIGGAVYPFLN